MTSGRIPSTPSWITCARACLASCWTYRINGRLDEGGCLISADDILVVAGPDLANLRNAKNLLDLLKASRPNDRRPTTASTRSGFQSAPRSPLSISRRRSTSTRSPLFHSIRKAFGTAANNGQMIAEFSPGHALLRRSVSSLRF